MPTYTYFCEACNTSHTQIKRINDRDVPCNEPCVDCGESSVIRPVETTGGIVSGIQGVTHNTSQDFRDVLKQIKKNNKGSTLNV